MVGLRLLDEVEFEMHAAGAHLAARAGVVDVLRDEDRIVVAGTEGLELLEDAGELGGDLREVELGVHLHDRDQHLGGDLAGDEGIHPAGELLHVLFLEGQAGGVDVATKILQQVGAALDGLVEVEAGDAAGGARDESVGLGQHDRGLVVGLHEPGGHDPHHALAPLGIVDDGGVLAGQACAGLDHLQGFLGDLAVDVLALVVVLVDLLADQHRRAGVRGLEELHGQPAGLHAPGSVDARADLEDDVVDGDVAGLEVGQGDHGGEALAGVLVELLEAEVRQHAVLPHHGHEVGGDADHQQVQQRDQGLEGDAEPLGIGLHELEAHATPGQVVEGIVAVLALGVQHRHGGGQRLAREMVVADDDLQPLAAGVLHLVDGLDAAVQGDDEPETAVGGPVDALVGHAVALVVAVGDVEVDLVGEALDERVDERDGRRAVHVVVAVDEDLLAGSDGAVQPLHGHVHVLHQERIVQRIQARAEEGARLLEGLDAALDKQFGQHLVDADLRGKPLDLGGIGRLLQDPLAFFAHITQRYEIFS